MKDVIIIGAGPAGSTCAKVLAEEGFDVSVYEKRVEIGAPKRCGEGLEKKVEKIIGKIPGRCIAQKIKGARVYAPNGKYLEAVVEGGGYILERKIFDKWLATEATKAGAYIQANTNILDFLIEKGKVIGVRGEFIGEEFEERASVVVFAGGSDSSLPRKAGINIASNLGKVDTCIQYEMANVKVNPNFIHIFLGSNVAPRGYAWIFPKGNGTANVGVGVIPHEKTPQYYLDQFIKSNSDLNGSIIEVNAGAVPVGGLLKEMVSDGFIVCGEAAHHVNPLHGGGIKEAIISGQLAGEVIAKCLKKKDTSKKALSEFNKRWWAARGQKLAKVEKVREIIERLSDEELNKMAEVVKPEDVIEWTKGARLSVLAKIVARFPRLLKFIPSLLR